MKNHESDSALNSPRRSADTAAVTARTTGSSAALAPVPPPQADATPAGKDAAAARRADGPAAAEGERS